MNGVTGVDVRGNVFGLVPKLEPVSTGSDIPYNKGGSKDTFKHGIMAYRSTGLEIHSGQLSLMKYTLGTRSRGQCAL
jgi:hypothetical protein